MPVDYVFTHNSTICLNIVIPLLCPPMPEKVVDLNVILILLCLVPKILFSVYVVQYIWVLDLNIKPQLLTNKSGEKCDICVIIFTSISMLDGSISAANVPRQLTEEYKLTSVATCPIYILSLNELVFALNVIHHDQLVHCMFFSKTGWIYSQVQKAKSGRGDNT